MKAKGLVVCAVFALTWSSVVPCGATDGIDGTNNAGIPAPYAIAEAVFSPDSNLDNASPVASTGIGSAGSCDCVEPHWFAAAEMTAFYVDATPGGRITLSVDDSDTAGIDFRSSDNSGYQDNTVAPRIMIGRRFGNKWSLLARYWQLDAFDVTSPDTPAGQVNLPNFATIDETNFVKLYNLDIEAMRSGSIGSWKVDGTFGARHSSFFASSSLFMFGVFTSGNFEELLLQNHTGFDGTGVTGSLMLRHPIGNTCASFYFSGRGSNAWGNADGQGRVAGAVASSPSSPLIGAATVTRNNAEGELAIGEFQAGVQWERRLKCLPAKAFFRTGFEYQIWKLNMPPIGGAGFGGTINDITINSFASAAEGKAEMYGLVLGAGLTW